MKSQAKHLMEFLLKNKLELTDALFDEDGAWWQWKKGAEARLGKFLKRKIDPRLKDAKDEVESLRMELSETRKTLEKAQEEIKKLEDEQWDV